MGLLVYEFRVQVLCAGSADELETAARSALTTEHERIAEAIGRMLFSASTYLLRMSMLCMD